MLAFMAGPTLDTGQQVTYLYYFIAPFLFTLLFDALLQKDQRQRALTCAAFTRGSQWQWPPKTRRSLPAFRRLKRARKPSVRFRRSTNDKSGSSPTMRAHLLPIASSIFKVGCRIEDFLRRHRLKEIMAPARVREPLTAFSASSGALTYARSVRFDSDSYPIGVDCHASRCMANSPHLFEDLKLAKVGAVTGINQGLDIQGVGTFKFKIDDDNGRTHEIKIPNSLYLPGLKKCLLSPQHWAQEAGDNHPLPRGTRMESDDANCVLLWDQGRFRKTIPHHPDSNVPIMHSASSLLAYRAFATTFEAMEANYFLREHVRQVPGLSKQDENPEEQEFVAEENVNFDGREKTNISHDDDTVKTSNASPPSEGDSVGQERRQALTFDPSPPLEEEEEVSFAAADDQAELMRWHYCLGHLPFAKLKMLAKNGEIPRRLAKVPPPKCAGCLFGAMTKVPWRGRESKSMHEIFVATKPGECVSVDHMISTQQGFFAQMKGKLTRKRYRAASIFVDHFSRLRYVHLMQDLSSDETIKAKLAFERFAAEHGVTIKHYHCDNGRFADNAFKLSCEQERQQLTFCGVNAHFQNGIAERAI